MADAFRNYQDQWVSYENYWYLLLGVPENIFRAGVLTMDKIEKTTFDQFDIQAFFDLDLEPTELIVSYTVVSVNLDTGVDSTSSLIAADEKVDQQINIVLKTGQAEGERHKITIEAISDTASTIEKDIYVTVGDIKIGNLVKQPADNNLESIDFKDLMELTETLNESSITITSVLGKDGSNVKPTTIGVSRVDDSGQAVVFVVKGGSHGDFVIIELGVECTDTVQGITKQFKRTISMTVKEK